MPARLAFAALLAAPALAPTAARAYDGGRLYGGYAYGPRGTPGYPLSLPQTLRGTVEVPLPAVPKARADTLAALYPVLAACWRPPPPLAQARGVEVTARFSLRRNGLLVGPPRITYTAGAGPDQRGALVGATLDGLKACMPARITPALGRAIAGHPIALRLIYRPPA